MNVYRYTDRKKTHRHYAYVTILWFCTWFCVGMLIAMAEYFDILPRRVTTLFGLPSADIVSLIGRTIGLSLSIPFLFLSGLFSSGHDRRARLLWSSFWLFHGSTAWLLLLAMQNRPGTILLGTVILGVSAILQGYLMLRVLLSTAGGVRHRTATVHHPLLHYLYECSVAWGELITVQVLADVIILQII